LADAWLDGYTPDYSTVVWMGYPNRRVPMTSVHGEAQQGGRLPADIWHAYMSAVTEGKPCVPFKQSGESLSYKPFFGKLATTGRSTSSSSESGYVETYVPPSTQHRGKARSPARRGGGNGRRARPTAPAAPTAPAGPPAPSAPPQAEQPGIGPSGGASPQD